MEISGTVVYDETYNPLSDHVRDIHLGKLLIDTKIYAVRASTFMVSSVIKL